MSDQRSVTLRGFLSSFALAVLMVADGGTAIGAEPKVVNLTQTGCQFLESENGIDHGFQTASKADCERINGESSEGRLAEAKVMELPAGQYVFRVANKNVPYELGFWVREADYQLGNPVHKLTKTSVSGGGLVLGTTKDYEVELEPGEYLYSCPLNTTPDYHLVVTD